MDDNISQSVYDALSSATDKIAVTAGEVNALQDKIKSGRYSAQTVKGEFAPRLETLRRQVADDSDNAIKEAQAMVARYREDAEALNDLDPAALTDDVKLFQSGIDLTERDIAAILRRNSDNRTMTQLALRYAQAHDVPVNGAEYVGGQAERQTADSLDYIVAKYAGWIAKPNARAVLDRFFQK